MIKIRVYYPSDEIDRTDIDDLLRSLGEVEGVEAVHDMGRKAVGWPELIVAITGVSLFAAKQFFGELLKEAAKSSWDAISAQLKNLFARAKLAGKPLTIWVEIEDEGIEIRSSLDTSSTEHLQANLDVLPRLFKELIESLLKDRPPEVRTIRLDPTATSGKFELAVGHDERERPIYCYDFKKQAWLKVVR